MLDKYQIETIIPFLEEEGLMDKEKKIGQHHLGSLLQRFRKKEKVGTIRVLHKYSEIVVETTTGDFYFRFEKPPMEWSEKQNKELAEFMKKVN